MTNPTERDEQLAREWFRTPGTESEKESEWVALVAPLIAQVRLEEAKAIQAHMDRYLNRDATTMEVFLFIEERIDGLKRKVGV